jgi:hypothetical protein
MCSAMMNESVDQQQIGLFGVHDLEKIILTSMSSVIGSMLDFGLGFFLCFHKLILYEIYLNSSVLLRRVVPWVVYLLYHLDGGCDI